MTSAVERDIAEALAAEGLQALGSQEVSTMRSPTLGRRAFRVDLVSGGAIKARHLGSSPLAQRLFELRRSLPDAFVPAFAVHGPVLLEHWVDGELLGQASPDDARLREAGGLLARLHATTPADGTPVGRRAPTRAWREDAERCVESAAAAGELAAGDAAALRAVLARHDPGSAVVGLAHIDFCGENMLIDHEGRLRVFDNDRVAVDPLGFDLGRSWYRWALAPPAWDCFATAYVTAGGAADALAALSFWGTVAAVKSAVLRLDTDPARAGAPVDRLRRIAATGGCEGVS